MGSIVYYFSATGNSLILARQLADGLPGCELVSMATLPPHEPVGGPGTIIGFVFPVFYVGLPRLVKRFVEQLNIRKGTYCFGFMTFGGTAGDALGMLEDILKEKGISLAYANGANMPGNYIVKYPAFAPDTIRKLITTAMEKADEAAAAIANGTTKPVKRTARLLSKIANQGYFHYAVNTWDEKFQSTDACTGCGLCAKVCPVTNINMKDRRPHWQHHCERCLACLQWCPCEAIEYGKKTIGSGRYRNPDADVKDIIKGRTEGL